MRNIRLTGEYFYLVGIIIFGFAHSHMKIIANVMFSIAALLAAGGGGAAPQPGGGQLLVPLLPVLRPRGPDQEGQQRHQVRYQ